MDLRAVRPLRRALAAGLLLAATAASVASPGGGSEDAVLAGRIVYAEVCAHCHGVDMQSPGTTAFDLRRFPHDDKARFLRAVREGKGAMPAWRGKLTDEEIEQLWAYVSSYREATARGEGG